MSHPEDPTRDHVRRPDLPWRVSVRTECGRLIAEVAAVIDRDQLRARLRRDGSRRTAFSTCMTCLDTAQRWPATFEQDPVQALYREVYRGHLQNPELAAELRGFAALVDKYRDEFDEFLSGLSQTTSMAAHRRKQRNGRNQPSGPRGA